MAIPSENLDPALAEMFTPEYLERRRQAVAKVEGEIWKGVDDTDPTCAAGHARGMRISVGLTSNYRQTWRRGAMDIQPQQVINVLVGAGVKKWVLMGLHGYVGYLAQPRATQDVDVLIPHSARKRAVKAIREAWPKLVVNELSVDELEPVVRFKDPADCDAEGKPKPVIDLMLPWSPVHQTILDEFVRVDEATQHRIPTIEAALVSKYAAMISSLRNWEKKQ